MTLTRDMALQNSVWLAVVEGALSLPNEIPILTLQDMVHMTVITLIYNYHSIM